MKLLVVGNRKHQLLVSLLEDLKKGFGNTELVIDVLSQETSFQNYSTDGIYNNIYSLELPVFINKFRFFRGVAKQIKFRRRIRNLNEYDYVHIHYVEDIILRDVAYFLKNVKSKYIVTIWGSDFFRASHSKREKLLPLLNAAETITIASREGKLDIINYYEGRLTTKNISICKFSVSQLYNLQKICSIYSKNQSKKILNLNEKLIITIGYNASKMQQHLKILELLEQDLNLLKQKGNIQFILPLTYPRNTKYTSDIKEKSQESPFEITLFTDFMTEDKVSHLRNATDIMLQLQTTDMFSASMIEHLAAKNVVITGSWLPYTELIDWGVHFESINNLSEIGRTLENMFSEKFTTEQLKKNQEIIQEELNRDKLVKDWMNLYK